MFCMCRTFACAPPASPTSHVEVCAHAMCAIPLLPNPDACTRVEKLSGGRGVAEAGASHGCTASDGSNCLTAAAVPGGASIRVGVAGSARFDPAPVCDTGASSIGVIEAPDGLGAYDG